ncbi:MAG: nucleotide exchange factor GrpE, partial [Alphaproteobacteria bacterium]
GAGSVIQTLQPGYELLGRLVRPAMVVVAAKGSTGEVPVDSQGTNPYAAQDDAEAETGSAYDTRA